MSNRFIRPILAAAILIVGTLVPQQAFAATTGPTPTAASATNTVDFYGKQVDADLAKYLEEYAAKEGLNLAEEFKETPSDGSHISSPGEYATRETRDGGVPVPPEYVYNPELGGLHDYCTSSPDQFPAPGVNADFSGPCARHDLCLEHANKSDQNAIRACDTQLRNDLHTVCNNVYTNGVDPRRASCNSTAEVYYNAVVAWHWVNTYIG